MREEIGDIPQPRKNGGDTGSASTALARLRAYVTGLLDVIATHPEPGLERDEALWRLEELVVELSTPTPSAPRVKSRWIRLAPVLSELRPDIPFPALNALVDRAFSQVP